MMFGASSACGDSELSLTLSLCTNPQTEQPKLELASHQEDEESFTHDYGNKRQREPSEPKSVPQWKRVKWTNAMVNLLIMIVTYLSQGENFEGHLNGVRKFFKIKWKSVSNLMIEKGFFVSSYQCKDKFNELNKRYMRLNDILGKEVASQVVEKPEKLDLMDHLCERIKDELRKILGSKHLFYKELCSYHNNDRLRLNLLPKGSVVEKSLKSNVRGIDDIDSDSSFDLEDSDEDDFEKYEEEFRKSCIGDPTKKIKRGSNLENFSLGSKSTNNCNGFRMEEMKLKLEIETLELERQWLKWHQSCKRKDRKLEKLKVENEVMKMENKRIALELKRMEMHMNNAKN